MKKAVSLVLTLVMLISIVPLGLAMGASPENFTKTNRFEPGQFVDVLSKDWFAENVIAAYEYGLVKGSAANKFNPLGNMTIAEAITLAARIHSIYNSGSAEFEQGNPWYQVYIDYAVSNGIISKTQFSNYTSPATRAQFASIFAKTLPATEYVAINNIASGKIPDVNGSEHYASAVYLLYNAGIITGSDKYGTFNPNSNIQRCEVATIATRVVDKNLRKKFVLEEKPANPTSVALSGKTTIEVGETTQWKATVVPSNANQWVQWISGNTGVATVDANGNIKGLKPGTSNITAITANGLKKTVAIKVEKALPISAPTNKPILPFSFEKNSVDGIKVCWTAQNRTNKIINYYTVRVYFYNAVGDPAYDEITNKSYKDVKYVGPVNPNQELIIYSIVGYVPACSKIVLGEVSLQYSDGTTEQFWYGWSTSNRR